MIENQLLIIGVVCLDSVIFESKVCRQSKLKHFLYLRDNFLRSLFSAYCMQITQYLVSAFLGLVKKNFTILSSKAVSKVSIPKFCASNVKIVIGLS